MRERVQAGMSDNSINWLPRGSIDRAYGLYIRDMHASNNLVFCNKRVLVPQSMRAEIARLCHWAHGGIQKCLQFARSRYFWPDMTREVEAMVRACKVCMEFSPRRQKEPMYCPNELVSHPLERVHCDIFSVKKANYLFLIDEFSLFPWYVKYTKDPSAALFVDGLKTIFFRYGFPEILQTDNGAQMISSKFRTFCKENGIVLEYSSPYNSRSNGLSESCLGRLKSLMLKVHSAHGSGKDFREFLWAFRCMPTMGTEFYPAQIFFNMDVWVGGGLPAVHQGQYDFELIGRDIIKKRKQVKEKQNVGLSSGNPEGVLTLVPGLQVLLQGQKSKRFDIPALVVKLKGPRSAHVRVEDGSIYLRNRRFMRANPAFDVVGGMSWNST